jgi:hypothetical protein
MPFLNADPVAACMSRGRAMSFTEEQRGESQGKQEKFGIFVCESKSLNAFNIRSVCGGISP